jgi:hypothetical protein
MWVLDHMDDLDADFRVFYRIDDIEDLSGPRFLALALRVFAYQGVMAARVADQQETTPHGTEVRQVESTREAISADPALSDLVSWGGG